MSVAVITIALMSVTVNRAMIRRWLDGNPTRAAGSCRQRSHWMARPGTRKPRGAGCATRAGLTDRTFFRHFADKREVLFDGGSALQELIVTVVADAPDSQAPIHAHAAGVGGA